MTEPIKWERIDTEDNYDRSMEFHGRKGRVDEHLTLAGIKHFYIEDFSWKKIIKGQQGYFYVSDNAHWGMKSTTDLEACKRLCFIHLRNHLLNLREYLNSINFQDFFKEEGDDQLLEDKV